MKVTGLKYFLFMIPAWIFPLASGLPFFQLLQRCPEISGQGRFKFMLLAVLIGKNKFPGMQPQAVKQWFFHFILPGKFEFFLYGRKQYRFSVPIQAVADNRMTNLFHVNSNLVSPAGVYAEPQPGKRAEAFQDFIAGERGFPLFMGYHLSWLAGMFHDREIDGITGRSRRTQHEAQIVFFHFVIFE